VARCLDGHRDDYRHLVARYEAVLLRYLLGLLGGDRVAAEEVAQEAFVRAYLGLRRLKKPASYFAFLVGIASRAAKEHRRARRRAEREIDAAIEKATFATCDAGGTAALQTAAVDERLWRSIDALPDAQRHIVLLR